MTINVNTTTDPDLALRVSLESELSDDALYIAPGEDHGQNVSDLTNEVVVTALWMRLDQG